MVATVCAFASVGVAMGWGCIAAHRSRVDTAMTCYSTASTPAHTAARSVREFAELYRQLYGSGAHEAALDYALVMRSMGDRGEHDFWLQVADALLPSAPPMTRAAEPGARAASQATSSLSFIQ